MCCPEQEEEEEEEELDADPIWKRIIPVWLEDLAERGEILLCVAICEVVRYWYYSRGPGRDDPCKGRTGLPEDDGSVNVIGRTQGVEGTWCGTRITNYTVRAWYCALLTILHNLELHVPASEIARRSNDLYIRQKNMINTTVYTLCAVCKAPTSNVPRCQKCNTLVATCGVCELPVSGVFAWCSGCNHGGHILHMKEYFERFSLCPTGCGHRCDVTTSIGSRAGVP